MPITLDEFKRVAAPASEIVELGIDTPFNPAVTITITEIPGVGQITKAGGAVVARDDVITSAELAGLKFVAPAAGDSGIGRLAYSVQDGADIAAGSLETVALTASPALYFRAITGSGFSDSELWRLKSDGTVERAADVLPGNGGSSPRRVAEFDGDFYFGANGTTGFEMWRFTEAGALEPVTDINPGSGNSDVNHFTRLGDQLYFSAGELTTAGFSEVYRVKQDGTIELAADINPGTAGSHPFGFTAFNGSLYFQASDVGSFTTTLWRATGDGIVEEVSTLATNGTNFTEFDGALYFPANGSQNLYRVLADNSVELAVTAGTFNEINSDSLTVFNGALYFGAGTTAHGDELWRYNANGTVERLTDIFTGADDSRPSELTVFNDVLYFSAAIGKYPPDERGFEKPNIQLHRLNTDGTVEQVTNFTSITRSTGIENLIVYNGELYFSADDGTSGRELWRVREDGVAELVADLNPGGAGSFPGSSPGEPTLFGDSLYYYSVDATHGAELFRVKPDGTIELVEDIRMGTDSSSPGHFTPISSNLSEGTQGDDVLLGLAADELISGLGGDDHIEGRDGADTLRGDAGDDVLNGGADNDTLNGGVGAGNDTLNGGADMDTADYSGATSDTTVILFNRSGIAQTTFSSGRDTLIDIENITGSDFNDKLIGEIDNNTIRGGDGNDNIDGGGGDDLLFGEDGNDGFRPRGANVETFDGGGGTDTVNFSASTGVHAFLDDSGTNGRSAVGDTFVDIENLIGSDIGGDLLYGDAGANRLTGLGGNDTLRGRAGIDQLEGGAGNDTFIGDQGADVYVTGIGSDTIVFNLAPDAANRDQITDFTSGQDTLQIDASVFGGGLVAAAAVQLVSGAGPVATNGNATFLYDNAGSGAGFLYFDADGTGAGSAELFAWLQNVPVLQATDFDVVA